MWDDSSVRVGRRERSCEAVRAFVWKTLPVRSKNMADVFKKRCPSFQKTMGNIFYFYGQRISIPSATDFHSFGNGFGMINFSDTLAQITKYR